MSLCKPHGHGPECIICERDALKARVADLERTAQAAEDMRDASDARVRELEAFVAAVREHILGECPGLTSADCIEAIRIDLHALEAKTSVDSVGTGVADQNARAYEIGWQEAIKACMLACEAVQEKHFGMGHDVALYCIEDIRKLAAPTGSTERG